MIYFAVLFSKTWKDYLKPFFSSVATHSTFIFGTTAAGTYALFWISVTFLLSIAALVLTRKHRHWLTFLSLLLLILVAVILLRSFTFLRSVASYFLGILTVAAGIVAFILADYYRRAYRYYITNFRIAMIRKFLTYNELYVRYENLVDIDVHMGILGRIFSFGNIIPVTAAGIGSGANIAGRDTAAGRISLRQTDVPRAVPSECFFGVHRPYSVRNDIAAYMQKSSSSYELKQIQQELSTGQKQ